MAIKTTRRRDGLHRFIVRARFDLDVNDLIDRVTDQITMDSRERPTSRAGALKIARAHCAEHGDSRILYWEHHNDWSQLRAPVTDTVRRLFPELADEITDPR